MSAVRASSELLAGGVFARVRVSCRQCGLTASATLPATKSWGMRALAHTFGRRCQCGDVLGAIARAVEWAS